MIAIERKVDFHKLKDRVLRVMEAGNIHMHLDLIAGLPKENYRIFSRSFNDVMAIRPEQLQLGFLKVLKGSRIHELHKEYGIVYRDFAPYEVLSTKEMSYEDIRRLKDIEELLETYYNSNQFSTSIEYLMGCHGTDFHCFESMADLWRQKEWFSLPHSKLRLYELLYEFGVNHGADSNVLAELLKHDLCTREKPKKWPNFIQRVDKVLEETKRFYQNEDLHSTVLAAYKGYSAKQTSRMAHLEHYTHAVIGSADSGQWLFYDYRQRSPMTEQAKVTDVTHIINKTQESSPTP